KGLLKTAIRDNNPVLFFEHKMEYNKKFLVDDVVEPIPFGKANVVREGKDITIVATSSLVMKSQEAAEKLEKEGISVEVIDLRTIVPLDIDTVVESVKKTGKLIVADEAHERCGVGAEIGFQIMEKAFYYLDAPVGRVNTPNVPLPFSPALEFPIIPSVDRIYKKVVEMVK
ncbi:MAG TPA: transketolase C-terminal domain-containing protein, partial [Bacillota bacterium]|nr:transketolase C-terminal domain-containing protein [Bacillota bacterium]